MPEGMEETVTTIIDPLAREGAELESVEAVGVLKKDFVTHAEIKTYELKAKETVRGSARHSSKFSNERAIVEDTRKQIDVLTKLSDHVADLEKRVTLLEGGSKDEEPKK
jgi:hypothetical protein